MTPEQRKQEAVLAARKAADNFRHALAEAALRDARIEREIETLIDRLYNPRTSRNKQRNRRRERALTRLQDSQS